jgi:hypothetical protein
MIQTNKPIIKDFKKHPVILFPDDMGQLFITAEELGHALGYADHRLGVMRLYNRHKELLEPFSSVVKLTTTGGKKDVTVFNEIGANIIAMKSNTRKANAFIVWAAKVISDYRAGRLVKPQKLPSAAFLKEMQNIVHPIAMKVFMRETLDIPISPGEIVKHFLTVNGILFNKIANEMGYTRTGDFFQDINSGEIHHIWGN